MHISAGGDYARSLETVVFRVSLLSAAVIVACAPAVATAAGGYPGNGYLGNADQKAALLSPAPLGPAATLEKVPAAAPVAAKNDAATPQAQPAPKPKRAVAQPRRPRTNPLDSFARDTRPRTKTNAAKSQSNKRQPTRQQTWPCTGGGICAWTTPR